MVTKILPIDEVIERAGLSRRTLYVEMGKDRFPKVVSLTSRCIGWPEEKIEAWIAAKIAARDASVAA